MTTMVQATKRLKRLPPPCEALLGAGGGDTKRRELSTCKLLWQRRAKSVQPHIEINDLLFLHGALDVDDVTTASSKVVFVLAATNQGSIVVWEIDAPADASPEAVANEDGDPAPSQSRSDAEARRNDAEQSEPISICQVSSKPIVSIQTIPSNCGSASTADVPVAETKLLVTAEEGLYVLDFKDDVLKASDGTASGSATTTSARTRPLPTLQPLSIRTSTPLPSFCQTKLYGQHVFGASPLHDMIVFKLDLESQQLVSIHGRSNAQVARRNAATSIDPFGYTASRRGLLSNPVASWSGEHESGSSSSLPSFASLAPRMPTPKLEIVPPSSSLSNATQHPLLLISGCDFRNRTSGHLGIINAGATDQGGEIIDVGDAVKYYGKTKPVYQFGSKSKSTTTPATAAGSPNNAFSGIPCINSIVADSSASWWTIGGSMDCLGYHQMATGAVGSANTTATALPAPHPNDGYIATWHGPTRSLVSCLRTNHIPQHLQPLPTQCDIFDGASLASFTNRGVISIYESPYQLEQDELSQQQSCSSSSGKASAICDGASLLAVGGVGPLVDLFHRGSKYTSLTVH